jgi:hypothetical protein
VLNTVQKYKYKKSPFKKEKRKYDLGTDGKN